MSEAKVSIRYYSDLLCVWAYVAEARLDELRAGFRDQVEVERRFVAVFGNASRKIGAGWSARGGFEGYAGHVREIIEGFGHVSVHPAIWIDNAAHSSHGVHAFVTAAAALERDGRIDASRLKEYDGRTPLEELAWRLRLAFFRDGRDIGRLDTQLDVAAEMKLPLGGIREQLEDGRAFAALADDYETAAGDQVQGSPTFVLNEGRQKLYGNVGYRIIETNIQELLRDKRDMASWC